MLRIRGKDVQGSPMYAKHRWAAAARPLVPNAVTLPLPVAFEDAGPHLRFGGNGGSGGTGLHNCTGAIAGHRYGNSAAAGHSERPPGALLARTANFV